MSVQPTTDDSGTPLPQTRASNTGADSVVPDVATTLAVQGPLAALGQLNARTRFRFTGVFQVQPPELRNVWLVDRENPTVDVSGAVTPVETGYCGLACSAQAPFITPDARRDRRLDEHPARGAVISYAGVPIRARDGRPWGALCHFDGRPRVLRARELAVLEAVAPLFAAWLAEHHPPALRA